MKTLTIRLPDDKHTRLQQLAASRRISMNKLIEELTTAALVELDAETRFRARAALSSTEVALRLLDRSEDAALRPLPVLKGPKLVEGVDLGDTSRLWELE